MKNILIRLLAITTFFLILTSCATVNNKNDFFERCQQDPPVLSESQIERLNHIIDESRLVQKIIGTCLGKEVFFGYELNKNPPPVSINISTYGILEKIIKRNPFIDDYIDGHININISNDPIGKFNSLKIEFYGLLLEAAHINYCDSRLRYLAEWGEKTKVIYPEEKFGEPILTYTQWENLFTQ